MNLNNLYFILSLISIGITFGFGTCFLKLSIPNASGLCNYSVAKKIIAYSYLSFCLLSILGLFPNKSVYTDQYIQAITLSIAPIQALLFTYTLISLINTHYITKRRIICELTPALIFIILIFLATFSSNTFVFNGVLYAFSVYYLSCLVRYTLTFLKKYNEYIYQIDNYYSEDENARLKWVYLSFIMALAIGCMAILSTLFVSNVLIVCFTCIHILFYCYFGIKFINYPFTFHYIQPVISQNFNSAQNTQSIFSSSMQQMEVEITYWVESKQFLTSKLTIEKVAHQLNTNRTYLSSYINNSLHKTFQEWINELRIQEAQNLLLENPHLPVGEIALLVGYTDKSNFGKNFTKYTGVSPFNWRKQAIEIANN